MLKISFSLLFISLVFLAAQSDKEKRITQDFSTKLFRSHFAHLAAGNYTMDDSTHQSIHQFFMSRCEISNLDYYEFLIDLKANGRMEDYQIARIDSSKWNTNQGFMESFSQLYHTHPAYKNYPVVNITREGAELYCQWLSNKINTLAGTHIKFRLPNHVEWMYAASYKLQNPIYPWEGPFLRNTEGKYLCNFLAINETSISRNDDGKLVVVPHENSFLPENSSSYTMVLAPVKSYYSSAANLYNMSGNAAELVADKPLVVGGSWEDTGYDVRIKSTKPYRGAQRDVGFRIVFNASREDLVKLGYIKRI